MLLWISLLAGLTLMAASAWLVVSMTQAERRARRSLYRGLGLTEVTVDFLMERNRDVLAELSYVRQEEAAGGEATYLVPPRPTVGGAVRPNLRLVPPIAEGGLLPGEHPPASDEQQTRH